MFFLASFVNAQTPVWDWVATGGGAMDMQLNGIVGDDNGNLYVTGYFEGSQWFGNEYVASLGGRDIFVAKMDSQGNWLWCTSAGGTSFTDEGNDIDVTADNCIMITGVFEGTAFFGQDSLVSSGYGDIFVSKLDSDGNWLWSEEIGSSGWDIGNSISIDSTNNVYIAGSFSDTILISTDTLLCAGSTDILVARLNSLRDWNLVKKAGGSGADAGIDIKLAENNRVLLCGMFTGNAVLGSDTLTSDGYTDGFVAEMNDSGDFIWVNGFGGNNFDEAYQIIPSDSGAVVSGHFTDIAFFDSLQVTGNGNRDLYIASINDSGNWNWVAHGGSSEWDSATDIFLGSNGDIYATGYFDGVAVMGNDNLNGFGGRDVFVLKLDSSGNWQWVEEAGSIGWDRGTAMYISDDGNIFIAGGFSSTAVFGNLSVTSNGNRDCFVGKIREGVTDSGQNEISRVTSMSLYPNPFNPRTNISFDLSEKSIVEVDVYNVKGQHVKSIVKEEFPSGKHNVMWEGDSDSGKKVSTGVYFIRMHKPGCKSIVKKSVLLK